MVSELFLKLQEHLWRKHRLALSMFEKHTVFLKGLGASCVWSEEFYLLFDVFQSDHILLLLIFHTMQYMIHSTAKACMHMCKCLNIFPVGVTKFSTFSDSSFAVEGYFLHVIGNAWLQVGSLGEAGLLQVCLLSDKANWWGNWSIK